MIVSQIPSTDLKSAFRGATYGIHRIPNGRSHQVSFPVRCDKLGAAGNLRGHEKAERVASKYRAQIFYDLHEHYREERKMDNYANRFGDLMCLFVDAQMNATRIGEDIELLKLFNMYNVETYVYDCLRGNMKTRGYLR